ncbi:MAG TPA: serine hydrolase [Flavisolibacter sp.]|nr:serine hydrolase [Flavisolibacter sp.]
MKPVFYILISLLPAVVSAQPKTDTWLKDLLYRNGSSLLESILDHPDSFQYQIIYTRIDRDKKNRPSFHHFYFNVDRSRYFNPASTVKLPTALAALEKRNTQLPQEVTLYSAMLTDSSYAGQSRVETDTSSADGLPSLANYIKKIFLVSDNDAYNRLYEFTGQQTLNEIIHKKGYTQVRITRRFVPMTPEENRHTNAIRFLQNGRTVYEQPAAFSHFEFDFSRQVLIGKAHYDRKDSLVQQPMDFTQHNNLPLEDLQQMLQSVLFPESVPAMRRFQLTPDDYRFLYHYLSALPSESRKPSYDTTEFFDSYTKFFFKAGRRKLPPYLRVFNKPGWSYGFLTDAAYVMDTVNKLEFFLSAVIYVNADGILNDNQYEYEETGYPFFRDLFQVIYTYEKERRRRYTPSFSRLAGN